MLINYGGECHTNQNSLKIKVDNWKDEPGLGWLRVLIMILEFNNNNPCVNLGQRKQAIFYFKSFKGLLIVKVVIEDKDSFFEAL